MATQIKDTLIDTFKLDRENVDKIIAKIEATRSSRRSRRSSTRATSAASS